MNPLDAKTPAALFGDDAMRDARSLKRAYARLVREHPPERDAASFEHIRRLYEQGREQLQEGSARTTVRVASDDDRTVQQIVDDLDPDRWRDSVQALHALARSGDMEALVTGYSIMAAVDPEAALAWAMDLLDVTGAEGTIFDLVRGTMQLMPGRARDPVLESLFQALPADRARQLRVVRVHTLSTFHPQRAAECWRRDHAVITADPNALAFVLAEVIPALRWELTADELRHLLTLSDDARLPLDDDAVEFVEICLHAALAASAMTEPSMAPVRRALRLGHRRPAPAVALALRDLSREIEAPLDLFGQLDVRHPGVAAALYDMIETCAHTDTYLLGWAVAGRAPPATDLDETVWLRHIRALADDAYVDPAVPSPPKLILGIFETRDQLVAALVTAAIGVGALIWGVALIPIAFSEAASGPLRMLRPAFTAAIVGIGATIYLVTRAQKKATNRRAFNEDGSWELGDDPRNEDRARILVEKGVARGYYVHEIAGAMERLHGDGAARAVTTAIGNAPNILARFNDCHVRRAVGAPDPDEDDSEEAS